jgi:hypothetical protein
MWFHHSVVSTLFCSTHFASLPLALILLRTYVHAILDSMLDNLGFGLYILLSLFILSEAMMLRENMILIGENSWI